MIRLWDVATGKELRRIPRPGQQHEGLAFSADGKTLAATVRALKQSFSCGTWRREKR